MKILSTIVLFSIVLFSFAQCSCFGAKEDESYELQRDSTDKVAPPNCQVKVDEPKVENRTRVNSTLPCFTSVQQEVLFITSIMFFIAVIIFIGFFFGYRTGHSQNSP